MSDWLFGGVFGGYPVDGFGAQQQQAGAEHWRRQQEGMLNAWPQRDVTIIGTCCPEKCPDSVRAEAEALYPNNGFHVWLVVMNAIACAFWLWSIHH